MKEFNLRLKAYDKLEGQIRDIVCIETGENAAFYYFEEDGKTKTGLIGEAVIMKGTGYSDAYGDEIFEFDVLESTDKDGTKNLIEVRSSGEKWDGIDLCNPQIVVDNLARNKN